MNGITEREVLDALDDVFLGFDESGGVVGWNRAAVEVTGYAESELAEMAFTDLFEADDVDQITASAATIVAREGAIEGDLVTADGSRIAYEFTAYALENESPVASAALGREITDRHRRRDRIERRERVLREMYEIVADRERSFEEQVEALLSLGREELGTAYGTLSRIDGEQYVFERVDAADDAIQAGDVVPLSATNCEIAASDERTLVLGDVARDAPEETDRAGYTDWGIACYIGAPVFLDDEVYGTFCFYDTTPRNGQFANWEVTLVDLMSRWVSYELLRERTTERLEQQNDRLERFASIVSHDLRNPLNVATGSLELAREGEDPAAFDRASDALDRMDALIDDVLTLARAGETIGDTEPIDLASACEQSWAALATADATLNVETTRTVRADRTRLRQLLENLFNNAVEHAGDGVTIEVGDLETGFYVADDGPGIPPEEREQVFEWGYSTSDAGSGFGLDIVTEIAAAHDWNVVLSESDRSGARFEITGVDGE